MTSSAFALAPRPSSAPIVLCLMGSVAAFAVASLVMVVRRARSDGGLDALSRVVVTVDGAVLLPLMFFSGVWLWRRDPFGYVLAAILLVKSSATFVTLAVTSLAIWPAGGALAAFALCACAAGLAAASSLLFNCLTRLEETP